MKKRTTNSQRSLQQQQDPHSFPFNSPNVANTNPPSPELNLPSMEWKERSQCLISILQHNSLPLVVMCEKHGLSLENVNGFDFTQPLVLYSRRNVRRVVATRIKHVRIDNTDTNHQEGNGGGMSSGSDTVWGSGGDFKLKEEGDHLLIPEDYKGWFAVLGSPEEVTQEKVVPHFRQVAQLALSKCERFLVGGKDPVAAVQMSSVVGGDTCVQPRQIYPGDVLRMGKIYVGESLITVRKKFGGKKTTKKEEKFLLCWDDKDCHVYLPIESRGTFYVLTTEGHGNPKIPIMRMPDICTHFSFPIVVKLLFGCVPTTHCLFTGTMVLLDSRLEKSVIGCSMVSTPNILLDIPINSDLNFFVAELNHNLQTSRCYKNALTLCHEKGSSYMRNMKVAYYITNNDVHDMKGRGDDTKPKEGEHGVGRRRAESEMEATGTLSASSSAPTTISHRSNNSLQRSLSCTQPSIVEEQDLFCLPETNSPESSKIQVPVGCRKSGRKSYGIKHSVGESSSSSGDLHRHYSHSNSVAISSPAVLRKDQQFYLAEQPEILPLKHTTSTPTMRRNERKPLPSLAQHQPNSNTLPSGHYMSMEETVTGKFPGPKFGNISANSSPNSMNIYTQAWDGEMLGGNIQVQTTASSTSFSATGMRLRQVPDQEIAQRLSSFAFDNTYLTAPVFRESGEGTTTITHTTARGEVTSVSSRSQGIDYYLTPCQPLPQPVPRTETAHDNQANLFSSPIQEQLGESNLALSPSHQTADRQPYETMTLLTNAAANQGTKERSKIEYTQTSLVAYPNHHQQQQGTAAEGGAALNPPHRPCSHYYNIHGADFTQSKHLPPCPPLPFLPPTTGSQEPAVPPSQHQINFVNAGLSDSSLPISDFSSGWSSSSQRIGNQAHVIACGTSTDNSDQPNRLGGGFLNHNFGEYQEMSAPVAEIKTLVERHNPDFLLHEERQDPNYTCYEGYDTVVQEQRKGSNVGNVALRSEQMLHENSVPHSTISEASTASEDMYENVQNIRLYKEILSSASTGTPCFASFDNNNNSSKHHSHFFDMFVNPPAVFDYVSPPPSNPHSSPTTTLQPSPTFHQPFLPQKSSIFNKPAMKAVPAVDTIASKDSNTAYCNPNGAEDAEQTVQPPPKPCGPKQHPDNGYLHAYDSSIDNFSPPSQKGNDQL